MLKNMSFNKSQLHETGVSMLQCFLYPCLSCLRTSCTKH